MTLWACLLIVATSISACGGSAPKERSQPRPAPRAQRPAVFPSQPQGVRFPTRSWPRGEWLTAADRAAVDDAVDVALNDGGDARVRAIVIVKGGKLVYERYSPNREDGRDKAMPGFSMAKSITSALVGTLVKDDRLDVDARAPVPEWSGQGDPRHAITLDDLLRMSSGLEWSEQPYPRVSDLTRMLTSRDAAAFVAANDRIGMRPLHVRFDAAGTWLGGVSAEATAQDFAKLGLLYLRDGVWDGERILPEGWVQYSRTPSASNREYGAGWWLDLKRPGVFYAIGVDGQVIAVVPDQDLTFVALSTDSNASLALSEGILDAFAGRR